MLKGIAARQMSGGKSVFIVTLLCIRHKSQQLGLA